MIAGVEELVRQMVENSDLPNHGKLDLPETTEEDLTMISLLSVVRSPEDFAVHFADKVWFLVSTTAGVPFVIGDNPITMHNHIDMSPYGNIGLAVKGIRLYCPLSSTRALAMWCPSLAHQLRQVVTGVSMFSDHNWGKLVSNAKYGKELLAAIDSGHPFRYRAENVTWFNSLQIRYSERFVVSSLDDFSLVRKMIERNDKVKQGPRMVIG